MVPPPQYVQIPSWRRKDNTNNTLPQTPYRRVWSPWNGTDSDYSPLTLDAAIKNAETWNLNQASRSPRIKADSSRTNQIRDSPWRKTEMSTQYEPFGGHFRPRLQLQIPGQPGGSESVSAPQLTSLPARDDTVSLNAAADVFVPQQAFNAANRASSNISNQEPPAETSAAPTGLPIVANLAGGLPIRTSYQVYDTPFVVNPASEQLPSHTTVLGKASKPRQISFPKLASPLPYSSFPLSARIESSTSEGLLGGDVMHECDLGTADQRPHSQYLSSVSSPAYAQNPREDSRPSPSDSPRLLTRGQAYGHDNARAGGRRRAPNQAREATHTNSRTWVHPRTRLHAKWVEVHKNLKDMSLIKEGQQSPSGPPVIVGGSFCVPTSFNEWIEHRTEFMNDSAKEARQQLYLAEEHKFRPRRPDLPPPGETAPTTILPFGGKKFRDGRSAVLAANTIWSPWKPERRHSQMRGEERSQPLWPCAEEMKEEGNERNTSQYRRFLALPRVPGNPTVNWKQKKILPMQPFDEVWKLPSSDTFYEQRAVTSPEEMEKMESMIGKDLLKAIDGDLDEK